MNLRIETPILKQMSSNTKTKYSKIDPIQHILHRPDMYTGSTRARELEEYISIPNQDFHIIKKVITYCPAILRIFIEPLSNAIDNVARSQKSGKPCTTIKVNVNMDTGMTSVWNDGDSISIEYDEDENCYNHSLIFGQLLTSSNYDDDQDRYNISGRNGLGIKLCLKKGTLIPDFFGNLLKVEDIQIGHQLIGDEGVPRIVTNKVTGTGKLFEVSQSRGNSYVVNEEHILCVRMPDHKIIFWNTSKNGWSMLYLNNEEKTVQMKSIRASSTEIICPECKITLSGNLNRHCDRMHKNIQFPNLPRIRPTVIPPDTVEVKDALIKMKEFADTIQDDNTLDISIRDYIKLPKTTKGRLSGYVGECVQWGERRVELDPYVLGLWLGDGYKSGYAFAVNAKDDPEILEYLEKWGETNDATFKQIHEFGYVISSTSNCRVNPMKNLLSHYNLIDNKHIPKEYIVNSREIRMAVLAGVIDSDGCVTSDGRHITIAQAMDNSKLASDLIFLVKSLGFMCSSHITKTQWKYDGKLRRENAVNINISGEGVEEIPTLVKRKKCLPPLSRKVTNTGKLSVKEVESGEYVGLSVDGNKRFVLEDFTVTHNCNVFSEYFAVMGLDPETEQTFFQEWSNNMTLSQEPEVANVDVKKKKGYTEVSWIPDFKQFKIKGYTQDIVDLYCRYAVDAAMLTNVNVYFNNVLIPVKTLKDYSSLYSTVEEKDILHINTTDAQIVVMPSSHFHAVSFVNGVYTSLGGTHVDAWAESTFRPIVKKLMKGKGSVTYTIGDVKKFFKIFVVVKVINPEFESQSKHRLESPVTAPIKQSHINTILKWSVIDDIKRSKEICVLKKLERKKKNFVKIDGLDPANNEGGKFGHQCTLILVEGLAAKTYAVKGIEVGAFGKAGRDWFGIYALRGKVLNVRNAKAASIAKNAVISDIIKTLGAILGADYTIEKFFMMLRYGRILIITDADVDGIHISGLLQNMIHTLFPTLLERAEPFITSMQTPIVRVFLPGKIKDKLFYDEREYKKYVEVYNKKFPGKAINQKYYKGLGSSSDQDIADTFGVKMVDLENDENTSFNMNKVFHTKQSDARKIWLEQYNADNIALAWEGDKQETISLTMSDFLNTELIKFSLNDCKRSIPGLMDGLKEGNRKALFSCFLRNLRHTGKSLKVAQLAGYVAEHSGYHHGEQNLYDTITRMANAYPGSNNIPLLYRDGQFGCVDPNTPVLMWDFSIKKAKDVIIGDKLVGDDGNVRNVTLTTSGEDEMYEICRKGLKNYTVNSHHILTLKFSGHKSIFWKESTNKWTMCYINKNTKTGHCKSIGINDIRNKDQALNELQIFAKTIDDNNIIDINVQEYLALPKYIGNHMKGIVNRTSIPRKHKPVSIDPYILGSWLADGMQDGHTFSSIDEEIIKLWVVWLDSVGCEVIHVENYKNNGCTYYIRRRGSGKGPSIGDIDYNSDMCKGCCTSERKLSVCDWKIHKTKEEYVKEVLTKHGSIRTDLNPFKEILKKINIYKNKHIPNDYIVNDEKTRLELLAGLIDTGGSLRKQKDNYWFDIYQYDKHHSVIIDKADIIARSLGFKTNISISGDMLCLSISGDITRIPTRVLRKKVLSQNYHIDPYCHNINIKHIGKGNFNGWHIDGNERFLLGDSTITHNTRLSGGKDAANARYIFTKLDAMTRLLFRQEDDVLLERVVDDGDVVEPYFYVPILPVILINGCTVGIGTGWSCSVPCYNPLDLVASVKSWLDQDGDVLLEDGDTTISLLPEIMPWYRGFTGEIEPSGDSRYTSWGRVITEKKTKVVDELPIGLWTDNFKEYLDGLQEEKIIKKVKNYSTPKNVRFVIHEDRDGIICNKENLKLHKYIYTSNMVLFDENGCIKKYNSVDEIIDSFCRIRLVYYVKRKKHLLGQMDHDIKFLGNKKRFLEEVLSGDIKLFDASGKTRKSRKTADLMADLESRGYDKDIKVENKDDDDDEEEKGYDYLLRLQFRSITEERINKLEKDIDSNIKARNELAEKKEKDLWVTDLEEFEKAYAKWLKVIEKEVVKRKK
jgi:DNA gyrase/topoisomerase IV subunit B